MAHMLNWLDTILVLLPALAANGAPVLLRYAGTPIDGGRLFVDGRRVLGDGKTWEGFATGSLYGSILAILISSFTCKPILAYGGILASIGAMLGDMLGAFVKRRLGLERGAPAPILDQLDFYSGSLIALYLGGIVVEPVTATLLAPLVVGLHRATNIAANRLKLKPVPW
jgi:CDP-2,3-bis-(O-geranylgeranyl)-sn-glycerol synthase